MTRKMVVLFFMVLAMLLAQCASQSTANPQLVARQTELIVFAATSLTESFTELGQIFEERNPGVKVTFNFANASTLLQQISQGAPADVFASAAVSFMDKAVEQDLVASDQVRGFARNRLVVILPGDNPAGIQELSQLTKPGLKLVMGAKEGPQGIYVEEFLSKASASPDFPPDFKEKVYANMVSYESTVKGVVSKVVLNEADAGIVFLTDAQSAADKLQLIPVPDPINVEAVYQIAPLKASHNLGPAERFVQFVLSEEGQKILAHYGFLPPKK
ncbi:MAG: molybdate ABC transporter substrate-binding protein [Bellilinea sp.]|nr:molybdate ABC transporter substrate-binding protein [Bellilinea sp.]